jgi:serine/threonine protein kinase
MYNPLICGSYGCIYENVPKRCLIGNNNIIKIPFRRENADKELKALEQLKTVMSKLDPDEDQIVHQYGRCDIDVSDYIHPKNEADTYGIVYNRRGNDIKEIKWTPDLLFGFTNVIKGIALMNSHNLFHRDLHPGNIVIDDNNVFRIIDFGDAVALESATERDLKLLSNLIYFNLKYYRAKYHKLDKPETPEDMLAFVHKYRMFSDITFIFPFWSSGEENLLYNATPEARPFLDEIMDNQKSFALDADKYLQFWIKTWEKHFLEK